ncbi:MAG: S8 family serine peptidase, partial [Deltaproteobacteria bacterium]|nr:S8 family serine peptidase [Deltaproteobacteria bacterium]
HMRLLDVEKAWEITQGSRGIKVAIISTGANYKLDVLKANIDVNVAEIGHNGIDDDGNGFIDDVYGVNTFLNSGDPMDFFGIGSYVASLIGGVRGFTPGILKEVSMIPINTFSDQGSGPVEAALHAISYAMKRGARIVELGFGSGTRSEAMCAVIEEGRKNNILFIAPAGNSAQDIDAAPIYPASCATENILVVATTDRNDELASYASWGPKGVHVTAPGHQIMGTNHLGQPTQYSGASVSSGIATAVAALALSANPGLSYLQLKNVLIYGVDPIPALAGRVSSGGRMNALSAVRLARSIPR